MREAGVVAVVAPSFGRLFTRNAINVGLPIVTSPRIDEHIVEGDEVEIDLAARTLRNLQSGYVARLPPMAPESLKLIRDGGIANYTRRVLEERRAAVGQTSRR
jgi:3-isopropylmalate/(R)-2-methylmalate dehydratase small subunit